MALALALALAFHPDEKTNESFIFEKICGNLLTEIHISFSNGKSLFIR